MALRWATFFVLVLVTASGPTFAQVQDSVKLVDENGNPVSGLKKNGVFAWWKGGSQHAIDESHHAIGDSSVSMGALDSGTTVSQVVSFTVGHPPALKLGVTWSSTADVEDLSYPPVYKIPIKFWILCAQAHCDQGITAAKKEKLARFLVWANTRLLKERAGIEIVAVDDDPADDGEWIANKTTSSEAAAAIPLDFDAGSGNGMDGDCPKLKAVDTKTVDTKKFKRLGAFNVYMVNTVRGLENWGDSCGTKDSAVVGRTAGQGTILHELCHDLSLDHIDLKDWKDQVGGERNLMYSVSGTRKYLSEGQVFRMHFSKLSGLNGALSASAPQAQAQTPIHDPALVRDCDDAPELTCPPEETNLWPGSF